MRLSFWDLRPRARLPPLPWPKPKATMWISLATGLGFALKAAPATAAALVVVLSMVSRGAGLQRVDPPRVNERNSAIASNVKQPTFIKAVASRSARAVECARGKRC